MPPSYEAESKTRAKRLAGSEGTDPAAGRKRSRCQRGRIQPSLPHVTRVPVLVELVHVVGVPGERAEPCYLAARSEARGGGAGAASFVSASRDN